MKLRIGESDLAGTLSVDRSGPRPRVEGSLKSDYIDIAFLRRGEKPRAVKEKASRGKDRKVLNDEPIPLEWMKAADASLEIDAQRLQSTLFTYMTHCLASRSIAGFCVCLRNGARFMARTPRLNYSWTPIPIRQTY